MICLGNKIPSDSSHFASLCALTLVEQGPRPCFPEHHHLLQAMPPVPWCLARERLVSCLNKRGCPWVSRLCPCSSSFQGTKSTGPMTGESGLALTEQHSAYALTAAFWALSGDFSHCSTATESSRLSNCAQISPPPYHHHAPLVQAILIAPPESGSSPPEGSP